MCLLSAPATTAAGQSCGVDPTNSGGTVPLSPGTAEGQCSNDASMASSSGILLTGGISTAVGVGIGIYSDSCCADKNDGRGRLGATDLAPHLIFLLICSGRLSGENSCHQVLMTEKTGASWTSSRVSGGASTTPRIDTLYAS